MTPHVMECHHKPRRYEDDRYCNARKKCGHPCDNWAGAGTDHKGVGQCKDHFGNAPNNRNSKKVAEAKVRRLLRDQPVLPIDDPIRALQDLTAQAQSFLSYVSAYVAEIDVEKWADDKSGLNAYVALLERSQAQVQRFLTDWVRLDLDKRLVALQERHVDALILVIERVLDALGFDAETKERVRREIPKQARLVAVR